MATARELKASIVVRAAVARAPMPRYSGREGVSMAAQRAHAAAATTINKGMGVNSLPAISQVLNAAAVPTAGGKGMWTPPEIHRVLNKAREGHCALHAAPAAHQVTEELSANEAAAAINSRGITTVTGKPWIAATVKYWRGRLRI